MEQYIFPILVLAAILGAKIFKAYLDKQRREQEAVKKESRQEVQLRQASSKRQLGRLKDQLEAFLQDATRPDADQEPPPPPTPPLPRAPAMPSEQQRAAQRPSPAAGHARTTASRPARPAKVTPRPQATVGTAERRGQREPSMVSSLRPAAPSEPAEPAPGADSLGDMLRGRNLARAIVLSEILGPPKGLQ